MSCLAIAPKLNQNGNVYSLWDNMGVLFLRNAEKCIRLPFSVARIDGKPCFLSCDLLYVKTSNIDDDNGYNVDVNLSQISSNRWFTFAHVPGDVKLTWHDLYPSIVWLAWLQNKNQYRECVVATWCYKVNKIQKHVHSCLQLNHQTYILFGLYVNPIVNCVAVVEEFLEGHYDFKRAFLFHGIS